MSKNTEPHRDFADHGKSSKGEAPLPEDASDALDLGFLHEDLGFQIHQARRAVRIALRATVQIGQKPAPGGSLTTLILVGLNPGVSQNQLADALFLDPSKVASLVAQLVRNDLVDKRPSSTDRRRQDLYLTQSGEALLAEIRAQDNARSHLLGDGLRTAERTKLVELLTRFQDSIRKRR